MKTIFRFFSVAMLLSAVGVTTSVAQDAAATPDTCNEPAATELYDKFVANYSKKPFALNERKTAIEVGKQFLQKYGSCVNWKEQADFVNPWMPKLEKWVTDKIFADKLDLLYKKFDDGTKAKKWDDVLSAGKEIDSLVPEKSLDQLIPMGMIGLFESYANNFKYNDDSLKYAKKAIEKMKSGGQSSNGRFGVYQFAFGSMEEAISELTYSIAYITYYAKKDRKGAIQYYFEVTQMPGRKKSEPRTYYTIGDFYREAAAPIGAEIAKLIEAQKKTSETDTPEVRAQKEAEIANKIALFNGYTERVLDAYSRAYKTAKDDTPTNKTYKENVYKELQGLYKLRFEKEEGLDTWIATTVTKPLPNPTSEVTPVVDPVPTTTTTTTTAAPVTAKPAVTTTAKPVSAKVSSTGKTEIKTKTTAAKAKVIAKKPIVARKGTR